MMVGRRRLTQGIRCRDGGDLWDLRNGGTVQRRRMGHRDRDIEDERLETY